MSAGGFIPAEGLAVVDGVMPERLPAGGLVFAPGLRGHVIYGPYLPVANGVYRVKAIAEVVGDAAALGEFDVFDASLDHTIYGFRRFRSDPEFYVRLYESSNLEFRFRCHGEGLRVHGVELEPLLMDADAASADALRAALATLLAADSEPAAVHRVLDRLAASGAKEEAQTARATFVAQRTSAKVRAWGERLSAVASDPSARPGSPVNPRAADLDRWDRQAQIWGETLQQHDVLHLSCETRDALRDLGYEADHIRATQLHRDYDEPPRTWHERPSTTSVTAAFPPRQPLFERYPDIDRSFQASMALGAGFGAYCPVTGALLRSRHGFQIAYCDLPFTFYRFSGVEEFYVCTGGISNNKLFLYLPRTNIVAWLAEPVYRGYLAVDLVGTLRLNLERHALSVESYLEAETKPAVVIGNNIYGHFFWTSLSGIQYAVENGLLSTVAGLVKLPKQFIEPEVVFPELARLPSMFCANDEEVFLHCVTQNYLPIHFTDISMNDALIARLRNLARTRSGPEQQPPAGPTRPLLWINLRVHTKVWINQAQGYANILNALYDDYGAVSAFIDGMADCVGVADEIRTLTRPEVTFYDGLKLSFYDTLNWALAVDAYISVISSGLLIVDVMAGKSGVAHAEHGHLQQMDWWHTILPGNAAPLSPRPDQVVEVDGVLYGDYDVDWRVLLDLIRSVLDERFTRRGAGPDVDRDAA